MAARKISGWSIAYLAVGGVLIYSGMRGTTLSATLTALIRGQLATGNTEPITGSSSGGGGTSAAGNSGSNTANQAIGKMLAAPYGWATGTQWQDLVALWNRESGWSNTADNPSSGAYGIAQALPPGKMPPAAQAPPVGTSSPQAQIGWGLAYIQSVYGSPSAAWAHEQQVGWY